MYPTAEVRWFYPGTIEPPLAGWFEGVTGGCRREEPRVDHYLRLAGIESLGVKVREGGLELKERSAEVGLHRFVPRVAGKIELWRKWRLVLDEGQSASTNQNLELDIISGLADWIAVHKERCLARFEITAGNVRTSALESPIDSGCEAELTTISINNSVCFTIALEAFGEEKLLLDHLLASAAYLFREAPPIRLLDDSSYGYPRWLNLL